MATSSTTTRPAGPAARPEGNRRVRSLVAFFTTAALLSGVVGYVIGRPTAPDPDTIAGISAALSADYGAEHRRMTEELTNTAQDVYGELMPLLAELDEAVPVVSGEGESASSDRVESWRSTTSTAAERMSQFGLGATSFNGTHGILWGAVRQLDAAVQTYAQAIDAPGPLRDDLEDLAAAQRDSAVTLWEAGAEQLDELNIAADLGHVHLFLPATGDPDSIPSEFREPGGF